MKIAVICDFNPFCTSSATANRYEGLIRGLICEGVTVKLFVCGGYNNLSEWYSVRQIEKSNDIKINYITHLFNATLFLRRINCYVLGGIIAKICDYKLKKVFAENFDFCWIAGTINIRRSFLKYKDSATSNYAKFFMEFSEYQELYKNDASISEVARKRCESAFEITCSVIKKLDCMAVMTKCLEKYYKTLALPSLPFLHLPMTVDLSRFKSVSITDKYKMPYIAFTGTYTNGKDGVDVLIKSFAEISAKYPEYYLYLAGFYHYDMLKQKELIARLGMNDRITYLGVLSKEQIPEFVCNADLLVLSRPDSHQAQGGFPTKLGEYLATGNPVCVTKVGEIPDYLEDNFSAFLATPGDVASFADAMDRALSDRENAKKVGLNGRKIAEENFSIDVQSKRLMRFLEENLQ